MALEFSNSSTNQGIAEQARSIMRVDATQWPIARIVASANHHKDTLAGYAIGADDRFDWDNTNHELLPIGTTDLEADVEDYSFLTDEDGNAIITLTRIDIKRPDGIWEPLQLIHKDEIDMAIDEYEKTAGRPFQYIKLADNIVRLKPKPSVTVADGLQFHFQRCGPYYTAASTTATTGFSPLLDRGFVINAAYDGALALGLPNLQALAIEKAYEEKKMIRYFAGRNEDEALRNIAGEQINAQ